MRIFFERTGGFAGMVLTLELDTRQLPKLEAKTWESLVKQADFFRLPEAIQSKQPQADHFEYKISVWQLFRRHTLIVSESAVPAGLQPLVDRLQNAARKKHEG